MSQLTDPFLSNPWRQLLLATPASFRGVIFHIESSGRASGRRVVVHEYPKRNDPYSEDMGRQVRRFQVAGYLIYKPLADSGIQQQAGSVRYDYVTQRDRLYRALEQDDPGTLKHPVFAPNGMQVLVERYAMTESRDKGGFTQFEMQFVESGKAVSVLGIGIDTLSNVSSKADAVDTASLKQLEITGTA